MWFYYGVKKMIDKKYIVFLNELRKSGVCNMFESPKYLISEFNLSKPEAMKIFSDWAKNFKEYEKIEA